MIRDLVRSNRTCRKFVESQAVSREVLRDLVELARLSPSGGNLQPLRFLLSWEPERNALIFPHLAWAAYFKNWTGPAEGERPSAYIVILNDTEITRNAGCDHGIAAQSILLGATEQGLRGCIVGSVQRDKLRRALSIPQRYDILLVIALGMPAEASSIEEVGPTGDIKYWRDNAGVHHVPKRSLNSIIVEPSTGTT